MPTRKLKPLPFLCALLLTGCVVAVGLTDESVEAAGNDPILVGAGDIAKCDSPGDEATAALIKPLLANPNVTIFTTGDNVYERGTSEEWQQCYGPSWGQFKNRTRPVIGNHDFATDNGAPYYQYFGASAGKAGLGYYSYTLGAWHIVVLNSNLPPQPGDAQYRWLEADLKAQKTTCQMALWHHPRFSSGLHGNDERFVALWQLLRRYQVDVVVNGHDHHYERFAPQDENGQADPKGPREFVVGTGGAWLYPQKTTQPNSAARLFGVWGVTQFTLRPKSYSWQFIPVGGTFRDAGTVNCQ
jgi:acid phosphatase type 7